VLSILGFIPVGDFGPFIINSQKLNDFKEKIAMTVFFLEQ
jgi:hypothetical protein